MSDSHRPRTPAEPESPGTAPRTPERRKGAPTMDDATLLAGLTPAQQATIQTMETFHWRLKFVRRPLFKTPIPVLFNREGDRYVVVNEDGTIDENPALVLRD
ncbi:hypothetical protein [uncultured Pseudoxanthomonas sp.]|uniref:hypothetical protein n=1 Tax=uncultured Pseudoxanthomonas sp. TaxID=281701 RepID=UPI002609D689|nr:hypothetical protein [uncultured Pseudoxanthomonas sp.]